MRIGVLRGAVIGGTSRRGPGVRGGQPATSRSSTADVIAWPAISPNSTRICAAPASSGVPPPSSTPTNAPGSVTRPTVRVWSKPGVSASRAVGAITSKAASGLVSPIASAGLVGAEVPGELVEGAPPGQRRGGHHVADHDAGDRDDAGAVERHHAGGEDQRRAPGRCPQAIARPTHGSCAARRPDPAGRGQGRDHEHQQHEGQRQPDAGQGGGDDQRDQRELHDRAQGGGGVLPLGAEPAEHGRRDGDHRPAPRGRPRAASRG